MIRGITIGKGLQVMHTGDTGFIIAFESEIMSILLLSIPLEDLLNRIS